MTLSIHSTLTVANGVEIPRLGLGLFRAGSDAQVRAAVHAALDAGYRLFDTAQMYNNERAVGAAIRDGGVPREQVFITSKLLNGNHGRADAIPAFDETLREMKLDYLDLFLIHWPVRELRHETWEVLVELQRSGRCRAVGVSNYLVRHLDELKARSETLPAVNQIEMSPYIYRHRKQVVEWCSQHQVSVEAYSPLTKGQRLSNPRLVEMAKRYGKTPAQILIRWSLQMGFVCIPKSSNPDRICENAAVFDFEIAPDDMAALEKFDENLRTSWDPTDAP